MRFPHKLPHIQRAGTRYPRPMYGMSVAMIVMNWTFVSNGRFDMYTTVLATCSTLNVGSTLSEPSACGAPSCIEDVMSVAALPMSIWPQAMFVLAAVE